MMDILVIGICLVFIGFIAGRGSKINTTVGYQPTEDLKNKIPPGKVMKGGINVYPSCKRPSEPPRGIKPGLTGKPKRMSLGEPPKGYGTINGMRVYPGEEITVIQPSAKAKPMIVNHGAKVKNGIKIDAPWDIPEIKDGLLPEGNRVISTDHAVDDYDLVVVLARKNKDGTITILDKDCTWMEDELMKEMIEKFTEKIRCYSFPRRVFHEQA